MTFNLPFYESLFFKINVTGLMSQGFLKNCIPAEVEKTGHLGCLSLCPISPFLLAFLSLPPTFSCLISFSLSGPFLPSDCIPNIVPSHPLQFTLFLSFAFVSAPAPLPPFPFSSYSYQWPLRQQDFPRDGNRLWLTCFVSAVLLSKIRVPSACAVSCTVKPRHHSNTAQLDVQAITARESCF